MTSALNVSVLTLIADELIRAYQRHVSPYKGFRCAYRALHGRSSSCSQFARRVLQRHGLGGLAPLLRRRFAKCREAAGKLKQRVLDYEAKRKERRRQRRESWTDHCDCGGYDCVPDIGIDACPC